MMTLKGMAGFSAAMLMAAAVASAAGAAASSKADVSRLKATRQSLAAKANNQKGYPRARLDMERSRVNGLIDDLEAGRRVDPSEIDSALRRAEEVGR